MMSQPGHEHAGDGEFLVGDDEFKAATGESIERTLDLSTWHAGVDLGALYQRLEAEVGPALEQERRVQNVVRSDVFPLLRTAPDAPADAGVHQAAPVDLEEVHRKVLFSGQLDTCDGTSITHDTLLLTVTQIGVCLISYQGDELALSQRMFRRDLRTVGSDPIEEAKDLLARRKDRTAVGFTDKRDTLSELARRGIMTYAERATLLHWSTAQWRMGHGNIAPYELLTGSGNMALLAESLKVLRELVAYQQFVFVPSSIKDRLLLTIGDALGPLEYAVIQTADQAMRRIVEGGRYNPESRRLAESFVDDIGHQIAVGVYRASAHAPATPFFAHVDRVHEAAHIAIADSVLQEHRGFPLSIDLADVACRSMFGADTFDDAVASAYREHGEPTRYLPERNTREN
ncbi:hypothetical protein [Jatrophihabitans lederbergiae]|uniref:DUF222 domain-containing protein n=1 Tax=Jatrophihabitans lederbergiae TaxID=3075547 RepID=A0ABU2JH70_9ACTN|nr:hypothetical protein [Jatrophihabitans sp. DSM 44399]MDT0264335.1 hypothetical protein [Jatrophihabitans sp. DSM 44399]